MPNGFNYRILVVDDEPLIRETATALLSSKGYEVQVAEDGFAALVYLRRSLPDLIISDLRMPNMSGFELLSVVRRRFPHIPVIAISGEYNGTAPEGLIADTFFSKSEYTPDQLFARITALLDQAPIRPQIRTTVNAPVWTPRNEAGYFVITCPQCLRSFPVPDAGAAEVRETHCIFCDGKVRYLAEAGATFKKKPRPAAS
jgi:CheY-like chemotaxis protein